MLIVSVLLCIVVVSLVLLPHYTQHQPTYTERCYAYHVHPLGEHTKE